VLWIKAFHIITMVAWFAGLLYLPRLYVYHAMAIDDISIDRFKLMEYRLYTFIATPAAVLTIGLGIWLLFTYSQALWLHLKMALVLLLILFHVYCGWLLAKFKQDKNTHSAAFYRKLNEIPTLLLIAIVILVVVKPF